METTQVAENAASVKVGYLYKYRPWAEGVFKDPWARRFFRRVGGVRGGGRCGCARADSVCVRARSLVGPTLLSYKSEHDAAHLPRASVTLDPSCTVEARMRPARAPRRSTRTFRAAFF